MPDAMTDEQTHQVDEALARGSVIEAIKLHRQFTGKTLKESKDFIEALIPRLLERDPARYAKLANRGKGCSATIAVGGGGLLAVLLWVLG
jgi:ribosomal protein L7/L12